VRFGPLVRVKLNKIKIQSNLISIILPVYNAQKTLKRAINSILNQTYINWELILINDGSTDNSISIIKNINDKRVKKIFLKKNKGLVHCLNLGISISKGVYIARMDADDISLPERLFCQLQFLKKNKKYDLVGTQSYIFDEAKKDVINIHPKNEKKYLSENYYFSYDIPHPTWMARSMWMKKHLYLDRNVYSEDQELLIRASLNSNYYLLNKPLLLYSKNEIKLLNKLRSINNVFIKRLYNYYTFRSRYKFKILLYITMDFLFLSIRFFYYLLDFNLSFFKLKTFKCRSTNIPNNINKILKGN
jgi:glycosyltransferase involved in cell wall biosynthesis